MVQPTALSPDSALDPTGPSPPEHHDRGGFYPPHPVSDGQAAPSGPSAALVPGAPGASSGQADAASSARRSSSCRSRPSSAAARPSCRSSWPPGSGAARRRTSTICSPPTSSSRARCSRAPSRTRASSPCSSRSSRASPRASRRSPARSSATRSPWAAPSRSEWAPSPPRSRRSPHDFRRLALELVGRDGLGARRHRRPRLLRRAPELARASSTRTRSRAASGWGSPSASSMSGRNALGVVVIPLAMLAGELVADHDPLGHLQARPRSPRPPEPRAPRAGAAHLLARAPRGDRIAHHAHQPGHRPAHGGARGRRRRRDAPPLRDGRGVAPHVRPPGDRPPRAAHAARTAGRAAARSSSLRRAARSSRSSSLLAVGSLAMALLCRRALCRSSSCTARWTRRASRGSPPSFRGRSSGVAPFGALLVLARAHVAQQNSRIMPSMGILNSVLNAVFNARLRRVAGPLRHRPLDVGDVRGRGRRLLGALAEAGGCLSAAPSRLRRPPRGVVLAAIALGALVGLLWGLPGGDSWSADSISPRSCGLGAIVETYWPGHFHTYPPLHMAILTVLSLPWMALAALAWGRAQEALGAGARSARSTMTGIEVGARLVAVAHGARDRLEHDAPGGRASSGRAPGSPRASSSRPTRRSSTTRTPATSRSRTSSGSPGRSSRSIVSRAASRARPRASSSPRWRCSRRIRPSRRSSCRSRSRSSPPGGRAGAPLPWRRGARGALIAAVIYGVASGALVNPSGFRRRLAFLLGPASQTWAGYPRGLAARSRSSATSRSRVPKLHVVADRAWPRSSVSRSRSRRGEPPRGCGPACRRSRPSRSRLLQRRGATERGSLRPPADAFSSSRTRPSPLDAALAARGRAGARRSSRSRGSPSRRPSSASPRSTRRSSPTAVTRPSASSRASPRARASRSTAARSSSRASRRASPRRARASSRSASARPSPASPISSTRPSTLAPARPTPSCSAPSSSSVEFADPDVAPAPVRDDAVPRSRLARALPVASSTVRTAMCARSRPRAPSPGRSRAAPSTARRAARSGSTRASPRRALLGKLGRRRRGAALRPIEPPAARVLHEGEARRRGRAPPRWASCG